MLGGHQEFGNIMTRQTGITLLLMVVSFVAGIIFQGVWVTVEAAQKMSIAGQTLADLSRAIEVEKESKNVYPDSIAGLKVISDGGDFSEEVLSRVTYIKTESGYFAFVGLPRVAYVEPGIGPHFR